MLADNPSYGRATIRGQNLRFAFRIVGLREADLGSVDLPHVPEVRHAGTLDETTARAYLERGRVVAAAVEHEIAREVPGAEIRATPQWPRAAVGGLPTDAGQLVEFLVHNETIGRVADFVGIAIFLKGVLKWAQSHGERLIVDDGIAFLLAADVLYNVDQAWDLTLESCSPLHDLAAGQTTVGYTVIFRSSLNVYVVLVGVDGAVGQPTIVNGGWEVPR